MKTVVSVQVPQWKTAVCVSYDSLQPIIAEVHFMQDCHILDYSQKKQCAAETRQTANTGGR